MIYIRYRIFNKCIKNHYVVNGWCALGQNTQNITGSYCMLPLVIKL